MYKKQVISIKRSKTLPFKLAVVILVVFQLYTIFENWNGDLKTNIISALILIGCIILITLDIFLNR